MFNPALGARLLVKNLDALSAAWLYMVKSDLHLFRQEQWYVSLLERLCRLPGFRDVWDSLPEESMRHFASGNIIPLWLQVPGSGVLQFRLSSADFINDIRFKIIHFTPFGARTFRVCAEWAEEEGVL